MSILSRTLLSCVALAITALADPTAAETDPAAARADIDAFIRRAMTELGTTPGLAVAVVQGTEPVLVQGYGVADTATGAPAGADTAFYIASSTKSFTALAVAAMARRGEVDLDAPVSSWVPDSPLPRAMADQVTLTSLLDHTSGIKNDPIAFRVANTGQHTPAFLWTALAQTQANAGAPYGGFDYTNAGYNIATVLIEHRFGRDWRALVEQEVLRPAGMNGTTGYVTRASGGGRTAAVGHDATRAGAPVPYLVQKGDDTMQSAGGLMTTANDLSRWLEIQINDGVLDGRRVFPEGLVASTHVQRVAVSGGRISQPYDREGYGLGWFMARYRGEPMIQHFGGFVGWRSHISFLPDRDTGVAVVANEDAFGGELINLIADYAYDRLADRTDLETTYAPRLAAMVAERDAGRQQIAASRASRASRPWLLTKPNSTYVGLYDNPDIGTIEISEVGDRMMVSLGRMRAYAEAFTEPESVRVELQPLTGEPILFRLNEAGEVTGLRTKDGVFTRR